jgi:flagellar basal-body rod modification protein FlgD
MQVTSATSSSAAANAAASTSSSSNSALSEAQFLKLLTEQLENQDPLQPEDDTQFLAQMAQFTSLQETDTLNQQVERLTAASYIGSTVTVNPGSSAQVTGQVTGVDTSGADPQLIINGSEYPLAQLQMVTASGSTATTPAATADAATAATQAATPAGSALTAVQAKIAAAQARIATAIPSSLSSILSAVTPKS